MFCLKTSRNFFPRSRQHFARKLLSSVLTVDSVVLKVKVPEQAYFLRTCHSLAQNNARVSHRLIGSPNIFQKVLMSSSNKEEGKPENEICDTSAKAPASNLTTKEKLKLAVRDYGSTVIVFHISISLISLGGFYLAASTGLNVQDMVQAVGFDSPVTAATVGSAGTFVVAYAIHKVFAPVRIAITLTSAPFIVRYLRNKGILKVKPTNPK